MKNSIKQLLIRALRGRAGVYRLIGAFRECIADYGTLIDIVGDGSTADLAIASKSRFDIAYILVEGLNDLKEAERIAKEEMKRICRRKHPLPYAHGLHVLGEIVQHRGAYDEALRFHTESLSLAKKHGARDFSAVLANSIGNTYGLKGDFEKSIDYFNQSIKICDTIGDRRGKAAALCNIGTVFFDKGEFDTALRYFKEFSDISMQIGDRKAVSLASNNIGVIYHMRGDIDTALPYYEKHLSISEKIGYKRGVGSVSLNLGGIYMLRGDLNRALDYFGKAYAIFDYLDDHRALSMVLNNLGLAYILRGSFGTALRHFRRRIRIAEEMDDRKGLANSYDNIGVVYLEKGEFGKAKECFDKAMVYLSGMEDKRILAQINIDLARLAHSQHQYGEALSFALRGAGLAREVKSKPKLVMALRVQGLAVAKEDPQAALDHIHESAALAEKEGLQFEYAKSLLVLAALYNRNGILEEARRVLGDARAIFEKGGATWWCKKAEGFRAEIS